MRAAGTGGLAAELAIDSHFLIKKEYFDDSVPRLRYDVRWVFPDQLIT